MYHKEWTLAGGVLFYEFSYMLHFCNHHHNQDSEQFRQSLKSLALTLCHHPSSVPSPCSHWSALHYLFQNIIEMQSTHVTFWGWLLPLGKMPLRLPKLLNQGSLSFLKKKKIMYYFIFGYVGSLLLHKGFPQLCQVGAGLHFSARDLGTWPWVVAAGGLSSCGTWSSLPCGIWNLPGLGIKPVSPELVGKFLLTVPPGKSSVVSFYCWVVFNWIVVLNL